MLQHFYFLINFFPFQSQVTEDLLRTLSEIFIEINYSSHSQLSDLQDEGRETFQFPVKKCTRHPWLETVQRLLHLK